MSALMDLDMPGWLTFPAAILASVALLTGCTNNPVGGLGELGDEFTVTVTITNVGAGVGTVDVQFSSGVLQNACPAALAPGESCSPSAGSLFKVESVALQADAGLDSEFARWDGDCSGIDGECTIINDSREIEILYEVQVQFDVVPAGG